MQVLRCAVPWMTNAQHNRQQAIRLFEAGFTGREISAEFPLVFYADAEGLIGQRYDSIYAGTNVKETRYMIDSEVVEKLIQVKESRS